MKKTTKTAAKKLMLTKGVSNGRTYDYVCAHEDDCATGVHGAALWFLKRQSLSNGMPLEQAYTDAGFVLAVSDIESVEFGPFEHDDVTDEVRISYWFGNANRYWPLTLREWREALDAVTLCDRMAQGIGTGDR